MKHDIKENIMKNRGKKLPYKNLMVIGTGSGVGKSIIVAAILRCLVKQGIRCAPFKAQNMALNSFVTYDGKEMGRAQAYQAEAADILPDVRMNPVLLKPNSNSTSQVIIMGRPRWTVSARQYYRLIPEIIPYVRQAFDELSKEYDVIVIEGAGSPAEINLQHRDIVNMTMAHYANAPCILVGDIDKGGVFAWLKGTIDLIEDKYRPLVKALLINKFRGDISILERGLEDFEAIVNIPFLGVLPWLNELTVDQEDGMFLSLIAKDYDNDFKDRGHITLGAIRLDRISNFTDFTPFFLEKDCEIKVIERPEDLNSPIDCLFIPGSKATCSDLELMRQRGLFQAILNMYHNSNTVIFGICGGYQMLGHIISDPLGIEGRRGDVINGLGLLPLKTTMDKDKYLSQTECDIFFEDRRFHVKGYEIHAGRTQITTDNFTNYNQISFFSPDNPHIGCFTTDKRIFGIYLHGIFDNDHFRHAFLNWLRMRKGIGNLKRDSSYHNFKQNNFEILSEWLKNGVNFEYLLSIIGVNPT